MSCVRANTSSNNTEIDQAIQEFIERTPTTQELQDTEPSMYLRCLSKDTPLELVGAFALLHDICYTDHCTQYRRLKYELVEEDVDE